MRLVKVENLQKNMELAKPIIQEGTYLLTSGQKNLDSYQDRLEQLGVNYVYVKDEFSRDVEVNEIIADEVRQEGQKLVSETFEEFAAGEKIDFKSTREYVSSLVQDIMNSQEVLVNLIDIKTKDNYTFAHSVNVAVVSLLLGKSLNLNREQLEKLGLGAITHDIGKSNIPEEILKKPGKLTEEEYSIIKEHPRFGYDRLKELAKLPSTSLAVVLGHHENYDGNGYPRGVNKNDLHLYPRIVAVADVYDALTSDRVYRQRWPVSKAVDFIRSKSGEKFDPEIVKHFCRHVTLYPNGIQVRLNNDKKAVVVKQNENFPERPVIRLLHDSKEEIDLSQRLNLVIRDEIV